MAAPDELQERFLADAAAAQGWGQLTADQRSRLVVYVEHGFMEHGKRVRAEEVSHMIGCGPEVVAEWLQDLYSAIASAEAVTGGAPDPFIASYTKAVREDRLAQADGSKPAGN